MKKYTILFGFAFFFFVLAAVHGQTNAATETLIFDSSDTYLGACGYTDTSTWTLTEDQAVTTIQLWYYWQSGESSLPVTVTKDGVDFATFTASRGSCDPYQASWCNADFAINRTFPAGTYTTKIGTAYQCLKPGDTGVVRLYGAAADANTAVVNVNTVAANTNTVTTAVTDTDEGESESNVLTFVLIGIIILLIIVIVVMFVKCPKRTAAQ